LNGAKGTRISAVNQHAHHEGLWPDMKLADARTIVPHIRVEKHDLGADEIALNALAHWMLRYSPCVAIDEDYSLALEITGCAHLFGGEKAMANDIAKRFARNGYSTRIAIANTLGACFALTHYSARQMDILPARTQQNELDALPVDALRLEEDTLTVLKRLGLKRIGNIRRLPRSALERRFRENRKASQKNKVLRLAQSVQWRLDQLSGAIAEPLDYIREPQQFRASKQCPALALEQGAVSIALSELLPQLCTTLKAKGKGARRLNLIAYRADEGSSSLSVSLSQPVNQPDMINRLFKDRLDQIDCGYGIDLFVLEAGGVSIMNPAQQDMVNIEHSILSSPSLAGFADTILNRNTKASVVRLTPHASHVPERAQRLVSLEAYCDRANKTNCANWEEWKDIRSVWSPRPSRIFIHPEPARVTAELPDSPPMQFVWRKILRKVVRARGPERILPEWWQDNLKSKSSTAYRDYYDVEDERGLRYWLFRSMKQEQLVTHDNDNVGGEIRTVLSPSWFVHGLF